MGPITFKGLHRARVTRPRPVRFEHLLTQRDTTRDISDTPSSTGEVLKKLLIRPAGRVMTREKL